MSMELAADVLQAPCMCMCSVDDLDKLYYSDNTVTVVSGMFY